MLLGVFGEFRQNLFCVAIGGLSYCILKKNNFFEERKEEMLQKKTAVIHTGFQLQNKISMKP